MKEIIVKIMVEVLSILGIVTKEIKQGRTSMSFLVDFSPKIDRLAEKYLKRLIGRKDLENALQQLDKLTQEEARMAAAEALAITRGIDERIQGVDYTVRGVDYRMKGVDDKVGLVIKGELSFHQLSTTPCSAFHSIRRRGERISNSENV